MNFALVVVAVGDGVRCGWGCGEVGVTLTVQNAKTSDSDSGSYRVPAKSCSVVTGHDFFSNKVVEHWLRQWEIRYQVS